MVLWDRSIDPPDHFERGFEYHATPEYVVRIAELGTCSRSLHRSHFGRGVVISTIQAYRWNQSVTLLHQSFLTSSSKLSWYSLKHYCNPKVFTPDVQMFLEILAVHALSSIHSKRDGTWKLRFPLFRQRLSQWDRLSQRKQFDSTPVLQMRQLLCVRLPVTMAGDHSTIDSSQGRQRSGAPGGSETIASGRVWFQNDVRYSNVKNRQLLQF